ncbi:BTB/POZ and MATH domain-containing protein 1-like [Phragmites australis]|uniref:BTB/POZ and MATH domain-containing protein 1-like n=1 Tax=Phragmites australis TaxID=29695 RepID=UPI002D7963DF|nr:BTB/POZ and MATH domain-containing protein 1-like [Phragmites australis]
MGASQTPITTTASTCAPETARGKHTFKIAGYSLYKGLGPGKFIRSSTFFVGGRGWSIRYYPDGHAGEENSPFVSVYLELMEKKSAAEVRAIYDLRLVDQLTGTSKVLFNLVVPRAFSGESPAWGARWFMRRTELEASTFLREDKLVIECQITVIVTPPVAEPETTGKILVPPSGLSVDLGKLLEAEEGADVAFRVEEEIFRAHMIVLAMRSPVFKAQLYGPLRDKGRRIITIEDMQPAVFKSLLHFIYTDSLPSMDDLDTDENKEIVKHLLVAADRYAMDRMKLICESILCKRLGVESVATTLALADRHHCSQLKDICIQFIISSNSMDEMMASQGYVDLKTTCPAVTVEIWEKASKSRRDARWRRLRRKGATPATQVPSPT